MNLHSLVQCRLIFGSLLHTLCPFLCCQSHSLCHTSVTPPAPLCSCFKHSPVVFLLPFPCCHAMGCLPGLPAGQEGGISVDLGSSPGDVLLLWCPGWWRARNSSILCLPISISCGNVLFFVPLPNFSWNESCPRVLEERQDSWVPQSPNTSYPRNEGNGVCAAAFPKLSWQFR